ncbi:MAG TPA: hypothetical protein EYM84_03620 [Flavobacteriales bacterium]|nr:hypothetical protein [Flavobacteriales bacterium]HIN39342.1 hypothetical protein [Flavobacteriales bacterium]
MKRLMIFAMVIISVNVLAQVQEMEEKAASSQLGYFYSPDYSHGSFKGSYGYATGFNFSKRIKEKYSIDIGLLFSSRGDYTGYLTLGNSINQSMGVVDTSFYSKNKHQFIEMPIKLKYFFLQKNKIDVYLTAGASLNYYLRTRTVWDFDPRSESRVAGNEFTNKNFPAKTIVLSSLTGLGIVYKLNEKWNFTIQPELRYYFMTEKTYPIGSNIYAVGLNCGISHNF